MSSKSCINRTFTAKELTNEFVELVESIIERKEVSSNDLLAIRSEGQRSLVMR